MPFVRTPASQSAGGKLAPSLPPEPIPAPPTVPPTTSVAAPSR
jgi:hypothetical protein